MKYRTFERTVSCLTKSCAKRHICMKFQKLNPKIQPLFHNFSTIFVQKSWPWNNNFFASLRAPTV